MSLLKDCINNKKISTIPIWFMRQAGRYLPEFRDIRSKNPDFIKLCLNPNLSKEITIQPLKRFKIDAAIIFSDILFIPYALGQSVKFEKNFGPRLGELNYNRVLNTPDKDILVKLNPIYELIKITSKEKILDNKDLIGFVGATWTILVYMLNKISPKKKIDDSIYNHPNQNELIQKIIQVQKIHIKNQVENGASIIQIFDSWAGLLDEKKKDKYKVSTIGGYYLDGKGEKEIFDEMQMYKDLGYRACKFKIGKLKPKEDFHRIEAARKSVSKDFDLMVDVNCGYSINITSNG